MPKRAQPAQPAPPAPPEPAAPPPAAQPAPPAPPPRNVTRVNPGTGVTETRAVDSDGRVGDVVQRTVQMPWATRAQQDARRQVKANGGSVYAAENLAGPPEPAQRVAPAAPPPDAPPAQPSPAAQDWHSGWHIGEVRLVDGEYMTPDPAHWNSATGEGNLIRAADAAPPDSAPGDVLQSEDASYNMSAPPSRPETPPDSAPGDLLQLEDANYKMSAPPSRPETPPDDAPGNLLPPVGDDGVWTADDFVDAAPARGQLQPTAAAPAGAVMMSGIPDFDDDGDSPSFSYPGTPGESGGDGDGGDDFNSPLHEFAQMRLRQPTQGRPVKIRRSYSAPAPRQGRGRAVLQPPPEVADDADEPRPRRPAAVKPPAPVVPKVAAPKATPPGRARPPAVDPMPPGMRRDINRVGGGRR